MKALEGNRGNNRFGIPIWRSALVAAVAAATIFTFLAADTTKSSKAIDQVLQNAVDSKKLPGVVAMVGNASGVVYQGAAGKRDTIKSLPMAMDTIFRIASMTKPVTSVAVMQLVESGRVKLDEPMTTYLPELAQVQVLEEFDAATKKAKLRAPKTVPTVRQLLTHTSGYVYEFFNAKLGGYVATGAVPSVGQGDDGFLKAPLAFDPGTQWEYGINTDILGRMVEKISGQTLEDYFREHIFQPLGMTDSFFNVPPEKQERVAALYQRQEDGSFVEPPQQPLEPVKFFSGGGGLFSTAGDYIKFERMLLGVGKLGEKRILKAETVAEMSRNQIGELGLVELKSLAPQFAKNPTRIPSGLDKFGLGFGINSKAVEGGRSAGSLAWAGIFSTYFWIDPPKKTCAVILMQLLPFSDDEAVGTVEKFERAVYGSAADAAAAGKTKN